MSSHTRRQKYLPYFLESLSRKWFFRIISLALINQMATLLHVFLEYLLLQSEKAVYLVDIKACIKDVLPRIILVGKRSGWRWGGGVSWYAGRGFG